MIDIELVNAVADNSVLAVMVLALLGLIMQILKEHRIERTEWRNQSAAQMTTLQEVLKDLKDEIRSRRNG